MSLTQKETKKSSQKKLAPLKQFFDRALPLRDVLLNIIRLSLLDSYKKGIQVILLESLFLWILLLPLDKSNTLINYGKKENTQQRGESL